MNFYTPFCEPPRMLQQVLNRYTISAATSKVDICTMREYYKKRTLGCIFSNVVVKYSRTETNSKTMTQHAMFTRSFVQFHVNCYQMLPENSPAVYDVGFHLKLRLKCDDERHKMKSTVV